MTSLISIVIPALDEELAIAHCLEAVTAQEVPNEVVVVDGGSSDRTCEIARAWGAHVIAAPRGRAAQLNAGAAASCGEILLFLHADTKLPRDALAAIRKAVDNGADAGGFLMRYDSDRLAMRVAAALANAYTRVTRDLFGDRAMFMTRAAFRALSGFHERELMEDLDLSVRMRRHRCRVDILRGPVVTSARRLSEIGILRSGWLAWKLTRAFHRGDPLDSAAARYYAELRR